LRGWGREEGTGPYHALHEIDKAPECYGIVLHDCIYWGQQVAHALNITKLFVVLIVSEQHVFHLLEMNIRPYFRKRAVGIRMRRVFASKKRDVAIGTVNILFYIADPVKWGGN